MKIEEIKTKLCVYDERNPDNIGDEELMEQRKQNKIKKFVCYCDNCFTGRTQLAEELLKLNKELGH